MKSIHKIDIKHFKVFRDTQPIYLHEGRNLLLYGPNGSGKSSIYWALYTFLQSSKKTLEEVNKYFDPTHPEKLINTFSEEEGKHASITLALVDDAVGTEESIRLALDEHNTATPDLKKANLASDFITYRVLFRFYHFTNSQTIDLFPVFAREILSFCASPLLTENLGDIWLKLFKEDPFKTNQRKKYRGANARRVYDTYNDKLADFSTALSEKVDSITEIAQEFYTNHFHKKGERKLHFKLDVTRKAKYLWKEQHKLIHPRIGLEVRIGDTPINKPQTYLNESKLTQIAISIRFGATKANLYESPIKLLVLDDLLISLDMSNRMQVIKIILSDPDFEKYQKIVMTHDRGFYNEVRRQIGIGNNEWVYKRLNFGNRGILQIQEEHDELAYAEVLLKQGQLDETAVILRKCAENTLRKFVSNFPETGKFESFTKKLRKARKMLDKDGFNKFVRFLKDLEHNKILELIIPNNMDDLVNNDTLSTEERNQCFSKRTALRKLIQYIKSDNNRALEVIKQVEDVKDRILNPAAHAGDPPLYEDEVEDALEYVRQLRELLCTSDDEE